MPTTTARAIITDAFLTLGVWEPGEAPPAADMTFALGRLQSMQSAWRLYALTSPTNVREQFALIANKGGPSNPYTIGPGGDFNTTRPASVEEISGWGLLLAGPAPQVEIPRSMLTDDAFQAIQVKDLSNALFTEAYYNATFAGGLGQIILWPVPNTNVNGIFIYRNLPVPSVVNLDASYDLPEGYFDALSYNLSVRLAKPYGQAITADLDAMARATLADIKRGNTRLTDLPTDPALTHNKRGGYNILSGTGG